MSLCSHAHPQSLSPLADSRVIDSLRQIIPHFNEALLQLVDVTYTTFVYTLEHDSLDLVVDGVHIWAVWRPEVRTDEVRCLPLRQLDGVAGAMCWSTFLYKASAEPQNIAVILAVYLHPGVDKYQFSHTHCSHGNGHHNRPAEC